MAVFSPLSCTNCETKFTSIGDFIPHRIKCPHDICKKCIEIILNIPEREELLSPEKELDPLFERCKQCSIEIKKDKGKDLPLIAALRIIEGIDGVSSSSAAQPSCSYDPHLYDAAKPSCSSSSAPAETFYDKAIKFLGDTEEPMNLHGLTEADLNKLFDEDLGLFRTVLDKFHQTLMDYYTDKICLPQKFSPAGESYKMYLEMIRLAANENGIKIGCGVALVYRAYMFELGLLGERPDLESAYKNYEYVVDCEKVDATVKGWAFSKLAYLCILKYDRSKWLKEKLYDTEVRQLFNKAAALLDAAKVLIVPYLGRSYLHWYNKYLGLLNIWYQNPDMSGLFDAARKGDPEAQCWLHIYTTSGKDTHMPFMFRDVWLKEARSLFQMAIKNMFPPAFAIAGLEFLRLPQRKSAEMYFYEGSQMGNAECSFALAEMWRGVPSKRKEVIALYKDAISKGFNCGDEYVHFFMESSYGGSSCYTLTSKFPPQYFFR